MEGHFANTRRGITIDLGRMNKILAAHKDDLDVVVQPGVGYEELNEALAQQVRLHSSWIGSIWCCWWRRTMLILLAYSCRSSSFPQIRVQEP